MNRLVFMAATPAMLCAATAAYSQPAPSDPGAAHAAYPAKPIRVIAGFPPASGADITARVIGARLAAALGQQVIVDNRPGAGSNIAAELAAKAPPDGYTLFIGTVANAINASLYANLPFDFARDFAPIVLATATPNVLVVHPSVPAKSVKELISLARQRPGALDYGSAGIGGFGHMCGELFSMLTKTKMTHVPFKGAAAAMTDTIAGRVPVSFNAATVTLPHVQTGRLRALAVTSAARLESLPDLPTIAEAGVPGYENTTWMGIGAPARTPQPIIDRLNQEFAAVLQLPDVRDSLRAQATVVTAWTPERFREYLKAELAKYGKLIKVAKIKNE
jgi:tripartite-type tricarboxylate transporter receptor subunit TctC